MKVEFENSWRGDYDHHRTHLADGDFEEVRCVAIANDAKQKTPIVELRGFVRRDVAHSEFIGELRPDGRWYASRDWNALSFDKWSVT